MWGTIGIISFGVGAITFFTMFAGLIVGVVRKQWEILKWSSVTLGICFVFLVIAVAADNESGLTSTTPTVAPSVDEVLGRGTIGIVSFGVGAIAFFTMIAGLIVGVARKRWELLKWSSVTLGVCFIFLIIALARSCRGISVIASLPTDRRKSSRECEGFLVPTIYSARVIDTYVLNK